MVELVKEARSTQAPVQRVASKYAQYLTPLAIAIATVKGALVVLYFMHRRWDRPFNGVVFMIAIVTVFVNNSHSFNQDENVGRMQDDARHALREIAFDISMAGQYTA